MKRTLAVLFLAALLVCVLAGCGRSKDANNGNGSASVDDTYNGSNDSMDQGSGDRADNGGDILTGTGEPGDGQNTADGSVPEPGDGQNTLENSTLEPGDGALNDGTGANNAGLTDDGAAMDAGSAAARSSRTGGTENSGTLFRSASYEQMLRNAHVHDADGVLTDGENSLTPGVAH